MGIDRRQFLGGAAAALVLPHAAARAEATSRYAAAAKLPSGDFEVGLIDGAGNVLRTLPLPGRAHDIAVRPGAREAVVFARRPGRFAVAFDPDGKAPPQHIPSVEGRHFFGHGTYSGDGRLMFSTENDIAGNRGVIGIRDVERGYAPIGVFASGGLGPHDIALLSDNRTLVVANGGIDTDPNGRDALNLADMKPSIAFVDMQSGSMITQIAFGPELSQLSIRHLAVTARDEVVFACQWEGDRLEHPTLVGAATRDGHWRMFETPEPILRSCRGYIGSVAVDASGEIALATSPRGNIGVYWDVRSGRCLGSRQLADVCGVAPAAKSHGFVLTGGGGDIAYCDADEAASMAKSLGSGPHQWDNHLALI